jgi:hypothetical protein
VHAEARFVLLPYLALDLPGEERCAVAQLLEVLEDFARRAPWPVHYPRRSHQFPHFAAMNGT